MTAVSGKRKWLGALVLIVVLTLFWGMREQAVIRRQTTYHELSGETMGTFYHIKLAYADISPEQIERLRDAITDELEDVENSMSTYRKDSEISRFNGLGKGESIKPSPDFIAVLKLSLHICDITSGAFDPTLGPLIDLWGFGPSGRRDNEPSQQEIAECKIRTGWKKLDLQADGHLVKRTEGLKISLSAIAKGYAVDRVAQVIEDFGMSNYMVEIGGEVYADGLNSAGSPWRIGIERPKLALLQHDDLRGVVEISDLAVATSGDYRNYFKTGKGAIYSHIIDPRTGCPVRMPPAGVSVIARDCATADALATALFVMGVDKGLKLVEKLEGVEALFIVDEFGTGLREESSSGFRSATRYRIVSKK